MSLWIKRLFTPPVFSDDPNKTRKAGILYKVLWFYLLVWVLSLGVLPFSSEYTLTGFVVIALLVSGTLVLLALVNRGWVSFSALAFTTFQWLATNVIMLISGGVNNPEASALITTVITAGVLAGAMSALVFTSLGVLSVFSLGLLEIAGALPEPLLAMDHLGSMVSLLANLIPAAMMIYLALVETRKTYQAAKKTEDDLRSTNQALSLLTASLESQVLERTQSAESARKQAEATNQKMQIQIWQTASEAKLAECMRGEQDVATLAANVIQELCHTLSAQSGALFLMEAEKFHLVGSFAFSHRKALRHQFALGEGLIGQAALEKQLIVLGHVPQGYYPLQTGIFEIKPTQIVVAPFLFGEQVQGVVELASLQAFSHEQTELLKRLLDNIGVAFGTAQARARVNELLTQTQHQTQELQKREETLKAVNEELQVQAENLQRSQEKLQAQQADLEAANVELEEKTDALQQQRSILDKQNRELRKAQEELQHQAEELRLANKYKSEFLANMSHELRTPLNSLLLLARMLSNNEMGNLTEEQVKSARVIYNSGADLLNLINDILDLSKVEAGRMEFYKEQMALTELADALQAQFAPLAKDKKIEFQVSIASGLPEKIETDPQRLRQVIKNLLANAFKFTEKGSVRLHIDLAEEKDFAGQQGKKPEQFLAFRVSDTGIGIPLDKQGAIFEAFQQADGSTSRKYGGTGLGLAIAREMINRLGGSISVESIPNQGSTFNVLHPLSAPQFVERSLTETAKAKTEPAHQDGILPIDDKDATLSDDRTALTGSERVLLIIEDDIGFSEIVKDFAHKKGFNVLQASSGEAGLALARQYTPNAIILDLRLPGMSGWDVLDALKSNPALRHIPVHMMSVDDEHVKALQRGVMGFVTKPVSLGALNQAFKNIEDFLARDIRTLLLVEDDPDARMSVVQLLSGADVEIVEVGEAGKAIELLRSGTFDCLILDLSLPDMSGFELLELIHADDHIAKCPIIVYTGKALTEDENHRLMRYTDSVIVKGVKSPDRLLDETALFLHRVVANLPDDKKSAIQKLYRVEDALKGKKILVVDDDMRNSFAISRLLREKGVTVEMAPNGQKALEMLVNNPDIDLILMDVMMPVMDGLETTQRIRQMPHFHNLPILALTAKAMKGDREKCLEAGASDYLSKPVDPDRLLTMLRVWLYKKNN